MPVPDDLTQTALHAIQRERTHPGGGWMDVHMLAQRMGLVLASPGAFFSGPLKTLFEAGMIERQFNATLSRDEFRSIGTMPAADHSTAFHGDHSEPDLIAEAREVDPAPTTIFPAPIKGTVHAAFVMDYRTDRWATMCGKSIKDPAIVKHERRPVQCPRCAEALQ